LAHCHHSREKDECLVDQRATIASHVRFGSDMCSAQAHVRFTPESDIKCDISNVRFGPIADISQTLFDYLVGTGKQRGQYGEAKRFGGLEVDDQFVLGRGLYRCTSDQIARTGFFFVLGQQFAC